MEELLTEVFAKHYEIQKMQLARRRDVKARLKARRKAQRQRASMTNTAD